MSDDASSWVALRSADLSAQINPLGAQLSSLRDREGRDLLWQGDPTVWAGRAPVLFPIVGSLAGGQYRLGGKHYSLSRHGFARGRIFETVESTSSSAVFRLRADDATRAVYPFAFELDLSFVLAGPTLSVKASVRNVGNEDMPASIGFHPGFRWPLPGGRPRANHFIQFEADEPSPIRRIGADGLLSAERLPTPVAGRRLALNDDLFGDDVVIFDDVKSRAVRYGSEGGTQIELRFPDSRYLGVWTKPGAQFVCIEPWQGITDSAGFTGDFRQKPGVFIVPPGATHSLNMAITLQYSTKASSG